MSAETEAQIRVGTRVRGTVTEVQPSGIVVQLPDRRHGFARNRELHWTRSVDGPNHVLSVGDEVLVLVMSIDPTTDDIQLSVKRASDDPWEKVRRGEYREGNTVSGEVVNVEPFGAFVEIEPGIDGLLHRRAIPGPDDASIYDLLWVGDHVRATIDHIDIQKRRIGLSIRTYLEERRRAARTAARSTAQREARARQARGDQGRSAQVDDRELAQHIRRVLVLDDDGPQAAGLAQLLRRLGYEAEAVTSGERAIEIGPSYDLAFLDIDLPGVNGIEVADAILEEAPQVVIVLITGLDWTRQQLQIPDGMQVHGRLFKPVDTQVVQQLLRDAEEGTLEPVAVQDLVSDDRDAAFLEQISSAQADEQDTALVLDGVLERVRLDTEAEMALVFEVDTGARRTSLLAAGGEEEPHLDGEALQSLWFSPVKGVAVDGQTVCTEDARSDAQFDRLLVALGIFDACVAVPVPPTSHETRHALFVLDPSPDVPAEEHVRQANAAAHLVAAAIHRDRTQAIIHRSQRFLLTGQLASTLLHEVRNKISDIEQQAKLLELDCQELALDRRAVPISSLSRPVESILEANRELRRLSLEYLGLTRRDELATVDVNDLLAATVRQLRPLARQSRVDIRFEPDRRVEPTRAIPLRLRQVFLNVALNAVQQMGAQEPRGGRLLISSHYRGRDTGYPTRVRFQDWGPGIHRRRWDWVFGMGTSTREDGAGLGLFVSRGLMRSMGGRISIRESYMHVGSTFTVELPTAYAGEVADG